MTSISGRWWGEAKYERKNPKAGRVQVGVPSDVSALEAEINRLVYQLNGLTEEEVKIVEGAK